MNATTTPKKEDAMEFTVEYFNEQVCEFRQHFGTKDFWAKPEAHRDLAVKALTLVYFNTLTHNKEQDAHIKMVFKMTIEEYTRRESMLVMLQLKKLVGLRA